MSYVVNKIIRKMMLLFIIFLVTAAAYQGYFAKWAFLDTGYGNSFISIVDGTGYRPFVFRRLLPEMAAAVENSLAPEQQKWLVNKLHGENIIDAVYKRATTANSEYTLRYYLIYFMSFGCFFTSILIMRVISMDVTKDKVAATLAPLVFAVAFPLLETVGGYFYDLSELFFLSAAALFACRGWWLGLLLLVPFAELNKESFFFFLFTLYPLLREQKSFWHAAGILTSAVLTAGLIYLKVKSIYLGNPGVAAEWHLFDQLRFFLEVSSFFQTEFNYGMKTGQGFFILHILFMAVIVKTAWPKLNRAWKTHTKLALAINLPLFLLFCAPSELRNLSLTYIAVVVMLAVFLAEVIKKYQSTDVTNNEIARLNDLRGNRYENTYTKDR